MTLKPATTPWVWARMLTPVVVVALACGGCSKKSDPLAAAGAPIPADVTAPPPPTPTTPATALTGKAPLLVFVRETEERVRTAAGVPIDLSVDCGPPGFTGRQLERITCTARFADITITDEYEARPKDSTTFTYKRTSPQQPMMSRQLVYARLNQMRVSKGSVWTNIRCDELPEFALLKPDQAYEKLCYVQPKVGDRVDPTHRVHIYGAGDTFRLELELKKS